MDDVRRAFDRSNDWLEDLAVAHPARAVCLLTLVFVVFGAVRFRTVDAVRWFLLLGITMSVLQVWKINRQARPPRNAG